MKPERIQYTGSAPCRIVVAGVETRISPDQILEVDSTVAAQLLSDYPSLFVFYSESSPNKSPRKASKK